MFVSIYIIAALCVLCVTEYFVIDHLERECTKAYLQIGDLSKKMDIQNNAVNELKLADDVKAKLLDKSREDARKLKSEYDKAAKKVLAQNVPVNCEKAVEWAAEQAPVIYEVWVETD